MVCNGHSFWQGILRNLYKVEMSKKIGTSTLVQWDSVSIAFDRRQRLNTTYIMNTLEEILLRVVSVRIRQVSCSLKDILGLKQLRVAYLLTWSLFHGHGEWSFRWYALCHCKVCVDWGYVVAKLVPQALISDYADQLQFVHDFCKTQLDNL